MSMLVQARPSTIDSARAGLAPARLDRLAASLEREVEASRIPGAVIAIARRDSPTLTFAIGHRDPASSAAMPADAVFSIASMTKAMVSTVILQLLEEGRLLLGDPVGAYLPELARLHVMVDPTSRELMTRVAARQPTIQDLLRHTSGMTYRDRGATPAHALYPGSSISAAVKLSRAEFLSAMAAAPLLFEPGSNWEYGFSTDVLGLVVEAVTGKSLAAALDERLWQPLGLADTSFALPPDKAERYAKAFATDPISGEPQSVFHADSRPMQWESGGGGGGVKADKYPLILATW
jgi:CubicO group peptidase (beta-lactamase class C family)